MRKKDLDQTNYESFNNKVSISVKHFLAKFKQASKSSRNEKASPVCSLESFRMFYLCRH